MARATSKVDGAHLVGVDLVVTEGHPVMTGWWYTLKSWLITKAADEGMGRVFPWVPVVNRDGSKLMRAHPNPKWAERGVVGHVWTYRSAAEQAAGVAS